MLEATVQNERSTIMRKPLSEIAIGDRVWVGTSGNPHAGMKTVVRVNNKEITLEGDPKYNRFHRDSLKCIGHKRFSLPYSRITGIATPKESTDWEAQQEAIRQRREAKQAEQERVAKVRQELYALFGDNAQIEHCGGDEWDVALRLSESQARRLAEVVRSEQIGEL